MQTQVATPGGLRPRPGSQHDDFGGSHRRKTRMSMYQQRIGARVEYLQEEKVRVNAARSLAERFPDLKSLAALLAYYGPDGVVRCSELKCTFNLTFAKALFLFDCPNPECIGGNFDLSSELARAVTVRRENVTGEIRCQGWKSKTTMGRIYCDHLLRYTLTLGYRPSQ